MSTNATEESNSGSTVQVSIAYVKRLIKLAYQTRRAIFLHGRPGSGKSSIVRQVADELGIQLRDVRLNQLEPVDLRGLPMIEETTKATIWIIPDFLPRDGRGILFFDEFNTVDRSLQAPTLQLILDRRLGNYVLPDGWIVVAAGNSIEDRAHVYEMSSALNNRFFHIEFPVPTYEEWFDWGSKNGRIHPAILSFLNLKPSLLFKFDPKQRDPAWPSPRCYDDNTELLTKQGFKYFKNLTYSDEIATLNPKSRTLEYQKPTMIFSYQYKGKMIHFQSTKYDLLVTPNHRLVAEPSYGGGRPRRNLIQFPTAQEVKSLVEKYSRTTVRFLKTCEWQQPSSEYFEPPIVKFRSPHKNCINVKRIRMNTWMKFLGWYLSEGNLQHSTTRRYSHNVRIRNTRASYLKEISDLVRDMGFKPHMCKNAVVFASKQIYSYLEPLGKMSNKHFPQEALMASSEHLRLLLETFLKGDGWNANGNTQAAVGSKLLADGLQELALKIGLSATVRFKTVKPDGKHRKRVSHCYYVSFLQKRYLAPKVYPSTVKSEDYDRNIHCVEVPNHTLLVRRNGKIVWSGNSWELASDLLKADGGKHPEVVRYAVGEGASLEFEGWWRLREKIPDPEQLFRKPTETEVPNEISLQLVVATLIVEKITSLISKKSAEQKLFEALDVACILASRLPPEVQTICLKMLVSSNNGIPAILFKCPNWKPLGSRLAKYVLP